ncbi:putative ribonuclease H-like domain-containing protein [Tanacetum coccineum]
MVQYDSERQISKKQRSSRLCASCVFLVRGIRVFISAIDNTLCFFDFIAIVGLTLKGVGLPTWQDDNEDVGAEANMKNLDAFWTCSVPVPILHGIHKDHPVEQIIGDLNLAPQTRRMIKNLEEHGKSCIERSKVFRNKKDKRGIVIKNKARLVTQGYTQEEKIDYDEVFALVARIKAIRIFLDYASFKDFVVYQIDVKSAFLYGKIKEEVYVCQPPGFEDPDFPDRVYKVEKTLYGLHQAPRAWYETLSTYLLDSGVAQSGKVTSTLFISRVKVIFLLVKVNVNDIRFWLYKEVICTEFGEDRMTPLPKSFSNEFYSFTDVKTASTPMETQKPLLKDEDGEEVSPSYYQVNPKVSRLHVVKRIFRYLKGQPKLGLWYLKDSPFDLVAYTDSDYVGASLDMKSTTGGCQFLRCRLILWQCKKQTVVDNSYSTKGLKYGKLL